MLFILGLCGQSAFFQVPHFHHPEETLHASSLFFEPGGKGYNQAVAARRMGAHVFFSGAVGEDADGKSCAFRLQREGISHHLFTRREHTAYAAILTDADGENRVTVYPGAQLVPEDLFKLEEAFDRARLLLLTPEIPEAVFAQAVAMAQEKGIRVIINPAPYTAYVEKYLSAAFCVTPNQAEAKALLKIGDSEDILAALPSSPCSRMLVTLGSKGAVLWQEGKIISIPAPKVHAKDTTGAGDCLNGAFCAGLLKGMSMEKAAEMAVRAASVSVQHAHALDGMPYEKDII